MRSGETTGALSWATAVGTGRSAIRAARATHRRTLASRRRLQKAAPDRRVLERPLGRLGAGPSRPLRGASGGGGRSRITKETPARRFRQFHIRIQARAFTQSALPTRGAQGAHIIPQAVLLFAAGVSAPDLVSPPPAGSPTRGGGSAGTPG